MRFLVIFLILISLLSCNKETDVTTKQAPSQALDNDAQYKKDMDEVKKSLKGDVRVKLKKDGKGYSWEITGKDTQEVLKANEALRKKLND